VKILAYGDRAWGKGGTLGEALKNLVKAGGSRRRYIAYVVHPDTWITEMGYFCFPSGHEPKEIHRVGLKKKK